MRDVLLEADNLANGETLRTMCPWCQGGTRGERSLSITRDDRGLVWQCFRTKCGRRGATNSVAAPRVRQQPRQTTVRPYLGPLSYLTEEQEQFLEGRIGWTELHRTIGRPMWAEEKGRYAFPIFGPLGQRRGYVLRAYDGSEPKALTRMELEEPHISWYVGRREPSDVVVVEDIPSAVRIAPYRNSASLCGTGLGPDYALELAAHTRRIVLALDADATAEAIRVAGKYRLMFESVEIMVLDQDFKDMDESLVRTKLEVL